MDATTKPPDLEAGGAPSFGDVFSTRRPKDAKAGLSSGLKSFGKGVIGGALTLVAAPVAGAQKEGFVGFAKGAAAGITGAVLLPVTGAVVGCGQVARGLMNQPEASKASFNGKIWNQEERIWVDKPQMALIKDDPIFTEVRDKYAQKRGEGSSVTADDYYQLLQVERDAPPELIKKQYFLLARKWHPDKNPGNEDCKALFQKLGEAYQVLSDAELRRVYDRKGKEGVQGMDFINHADFFAMLFGNSKFEGLTGELMLTTMARYGGEMKEDQVEKIQEMRISEIVKHMKSDWLEPYETGEADFRTFINSKANLQLGPTEYGGVLLVTLGRIYEIQAQIVRGNFLTGTVARIKQRGDGLKTVVGAASAALKVMTVQSQLESEAKQRLEHTEELKASNDREMQEKQLPAMLEAMWAANCMDMQGVVVKACHRLLREPGVPKKVLRDRAEALGIIGTIFQQAGRDVLSHDAALEKRTPQQKLEDTMMKMAQKQDQNDVEHGNCYM